MCGLFGAVAPGLTSAARSAEILDGVLQLGVMAEERGRASAGVAVLVRGGKRVRYTALGPFRLLVEGFAWEPPVVGHAWLGHTRWPTQGPVIRANTSPLLVGDVLGTHNGDIAQASVPGMVAVPGATDTHALLAGIAALQPGRGYEQLVTRLLTRVVGRAALVWHDRRDGRNRVWLARSGLSPLAVARDEDGTVWWASNPQWLRLLGLRPQLMGHGSLLSVTPLARDVELVGHTEWVPTVRLSDLALLSIAVWRGFTTADERDDRDGLRYEIDYTNSVEG
ncbi:Glucosamine--fructose-6-phosphate aminotransferase [isomerizing] [Mycobacteroides abscessus subsp. abscessus]|nr:Glucosamine--fructose-6-phosphate aminotransferase [isomerizing] [Mycobacteroides abscessus subsp. abscessus]